MIYFTMTRLAILIILEWKDLSFFFLAHVWQQRQYDKVVVL